MISPLLYFSDDMMYVAMAARATEVKGYSHTCTWRRTPPEKLHATNPHIIFLV